MDEVDDPDDMDKEDEARRQRVNRAPNWLVHRSYRGAEIVTWPCGTHWHAKVITAGGQTRYLSVKVRDPRPMPYATEDDAACFTQMIIDALYAGDGVGR